MSKFSLEGKGAIITGAASGIGEAIARVFADCGASVYIIDVNTEGVKVAAEINQQGGSAQFIKCDITDLAAVQKAVSKVTSEHSLDILVNNAGIAHVGSITETSPTDFDRVMSVNVKGMFHCIQSCIPHMQQNGGGAIVNIASTLSSVAIAHRFAYGTSKGAVLAMTYSVALDYIDDGIRCNAISPGRVHTPFVDGFIAKNYPGREKEKFVELSKDHPIGRMAKPEEIAHLALYLCSDEAAYATGSNHHIDGGFTNLKRF